MEALGWNALTNRAWTDSESGKSREIDVWAGKNFLALKSPTMTVSANLLVECKNTAAPYAFLTRPLSLRDLGQAPKEFSFPVARYQKVISDDGTRRMEQFAAAV